MPRQTTLPYKFVYAAIVIFLLMSCDDFNTEPKTLGAADERAIELFSDTTIVPVSINTYLIADSVLNGITWSDLIDSLVKYDKQISLNDSVYSLSIAVKDTTFLLLNCNSDEKIVFFYQSYVLMEIVDQDGIEYPILDDSIPYATMAGYYNSADQILIKARFEYKLVPDNNYIIKIITHDQTIDLNKDNVPDLFKMVVVEDK